MPAETHVEKGPLDRQQILELIRELLADILEIEPSTISESSSFAEDLDADSLALIELVEGLEEELGERSVGFRIDDEDLEELRTVRDAVDYVDAKLGEARGARWRRPGGSANRTATTSSPSGSATSSPGLSCYDRPSPTVRGVPRTVATSPTNASSTWGTPCSA